MEGLERAPPHVERALLDVDRRVREGAEQDRRSATGGSQVPVEEALHEADPHDAHGPGEVLGPGLDQRRQRHGRHADHGLSLEVAEERERIGGDVGGGVRVAQARGDGGGDEAEAGDDGRRPADTVLLDRLGVGQLGLDAGNRIVTARRVDVDADQTVEIGDGVGDPCERRARQRLRSPPRARARFPQTTTTTTTTTTTRMSPRRRRGNEDGTLLPGTRLMTSSPMSRKLVDMVN